LAALSFTLSLHDALPICGVGRACPRGAVSGGRPALQQLLAVWHGAFGGGEDDGAGFILEAEGEHFGAERADLAGREVDHRHDLPDRKSTRLNSSHVKSSY